MVNRRLAVLIALAAATAAAACTEELPTTPASSFTGTWDLQSVNGAALPFTLSTGLDGTKVLLVDSRLETRTRGRVSDIHRTLSQSVNGTRFNEVIDTVESPYSATPTVLFIRRYALTASTDWVDTGTVSSSSLQLKARYLVEQFGRVFNANLSYLRRP